MLLGKNFLVQNPSSLSISNLCNTCKSIKQALQIHARIILSGLHDHVFFAGRLISLFALLGSEDGLDQGRLIFSQTNQPDLFIWNTMIRGYSRSSYPHESFILYASMITKGMQSPNHYTYTFLLGACAQLPCLKEGSEIHCHIVKKGFESDFFIRNSLIHLYSGFGYLDHARNMFDGNCLRDLVSYNIMLNGYAQAGWPESAMHLFREMQNLSIWPDEFTFVALFSACSLLKNHRVGKKIHALVYKLCSVDSSTLVRSSIIDMYAKCGLMNMAEHVFGTMKTGRSLAAWSSMISGYARCGEIEISRRFFDQMQVRDLVSWTAMISAYSQAGQGSEALELFVEMEAQGIKPDEVTVVAVVSACAQLGALDFGRRLIHRYAKNMLFGQNIILTTATIALHAKCGNIDAALNIFHKVPKNLKTVFLFNSMISGLALHGLGESAVTMFREMESLGLKPDEVTFVGLLNACSHSGLVEEGKKLFESMFSIYGIRHQKEHYGCMVDLLGRGGCLGEAYDMIQEVPFEGNTVMWRALLSACRIHGNVSMGEMAGKKLLEMEPDHGACYVLLSNMFADVNQWEEAVRERQLMEDKSIQKPPGWSSIEFNGTLHRFLASDKSHLQVKEIVLKLNDMADQLKSVGYVPNTAQVMFDIDEEEKQTVVFYHSERLALAFGLIHFSPNNVIRIVKNLRICSDCHLAFKLLSKIYRREITVRDTSRFHHFENGSCSCKDFW